jgi:transposase InsO family protein
MRGVAYSPDFKALMMGLHQQGETFSALSRRHHIARELLSRWWHDYSQGGLAALQPQSRRPHHSPTKTSARTVRHVLQLRAARRSAVWIARELGLGYGTVQRMLETHAVNQLPRPARPKPRRYEKQRPGELLHIDLKYLPALRNARNDFEFAAVDDFSREAVVAIRTDQTSAVAAAFLEHVLAALPYRVEAVLTDNAFVFTMRHAQHSDRLTRFQQVCAAHSIRHYLLRPYAPQSNGKVERFFRTIDDECLHVRQLFTFAARSRAVDDFVWYYNHERPHLSLGGMTPVDRRKLYFARLSETYVLVQHT